MLDLLERLNKAGFVVSFKPIPQESEAHAQRVWCDIELAEVRLARASAGSVEVALGLATDKALRILVTNYSKSTVATV